MRNAMSPAYGCQAGVMTDMWNGRFAPSPTGELHIGNLRTALVAWMIARSNGGRFVIRMEDLDASVARRGFAEAQLRDLAAIGVDWDGDVVFQSDRSELYEAALSRLRADDLVYECFCTRKEIQAASHAPNGPQLEGRYPGTCRDLNSTERSRRQDLGRPPALRLRTDRDEEMVNDLLCGLHTFPIDDFVLRRNDGVWAYNLAVVVDDAEQQIGTVVRADDLLSSTPRQSHLQQLLGLPLPQYVHVPLVVNERGDRLAKRDGAVTLNDRIAAGESAASVVEQLIGSLGESVVRRGEPVRLERISREPWVFRP
jgi:glutamyl-tRNA synthetase